MYFPRLQSDQLYTWSDEIGKSTCCRLEKTSPSASSPVAPAPGDPARLADRTVQALWQARLQMRRRPRPWPQVLSFGELPEPAATNGLCSAGVARPNCRVRGQLPPSSRNLRSDLRDQPRTTAPPGGALNSRYERKALHPPFTS